MQKKLRQEIRAMEQAIHARGDVDFTAADLDGMPYLSAVIKVSSSINLYLLWLSVDHF